MSSISPGSFALATKSLRMACKFENLKSTVFPYKRDVDPYIPTPLAKATDLSLLSFRWLILL